MVMLYAVSVYLHIGKYQKSHLFSVCKCIAGKGKELWMSVAFFSVHSFGGVSGLGRIWDLGHGSHAEG